MSMGYAAKVEQVFTLMAQHNLSIYDLELWGHIESEEDRLSVTPEEAYTELVNSGFTLAGGGNIEHYYAATADYVSQALDKAGLVNTGEWRVVIETMHEEYLYELEATDREAAVQQAYINALGDGLPAGTLWTAKTVEAI